MVVGPGLSTKDGVKDAVFSIVENCPVPLVIDADGLNAVASDISILKRGRTQMVLTPHPGEMARLLGITVLDVVSNRIKTAREFSEKWDVVTVLKGSRTIVALPDGRVFIKYYREFRDGNCRKWRCIGRYNCRSYGAGA